MEPPMKTMAYTLDEPGVLRSAHVFALTEGVLLLLCGLAALCFPAFAGIATSVLFGWILIASGVTGLVVTLVRSGYTHVGWSLFSSALAIVAGLLIAFDPFAGAMVVTAVIAAWLFLDGISSFMIALDLRRSRRPTWGWLIVSAITDWLLAAVIFFLNPVASLLVVGLIVGIDLCVAGIALLGLGWNLRRMVRG